MPPHTTRVWKLANAPIDVVTDDTFALDTVELPELQDGELLLQTVYLSNDPAQRSWIQRDADSARTYLRPVRPGQVMASVGIYRIVESRSDRWRQGQLVRCLGGWVEYAIAHETKVAEVIDMPGYSPTMSIGALGSPALTAWFGLTTVCDVRPEHCVLVSGAAGATGSMTVQIAKKMLGVSRVIGIAGGPRKCAYVKSIGADECLDYKDPNFRQHLIAATEGYVDKFLDMVGGEILDAVLPRIKRYGTVAVIGAISTYNNPTGTHLTNWHEVITNRLSFHGFIVTDFANDFPAALRELAKGFEDGRLSFEGGETMCEVPFERIPEVWKGLFTGINTGKLVTKLV